MPRMFPRALLACIVEGRSPNPRELASVTAKMRREVFARGTMEAAPRLAAAMARLALAGEAQNPQAS